MKKRQIRFGIWTPAAVILCAKCHGNVVPSALFDPVTMKFKDKIFDENSPEWINSITVHDLKESNGITFCDICHVEIQVDSSLAEEHNLVAEFRKLGLDAHMEQLGGMNSACCVYCSNGYCFLIAYNWDGNDGYATTMYDRDGEPVGEGLWFTTRDELFKALEDLKTI